MQEGRKYQHKKKNNGTVVKKRFFATFRLVSTLLPGTARRWIILAIAGPFAFCFRALFRPCPPTGVARSGGKSCTTSRRFARCHCCLSLSCATSAAVVIRSRAFKQLSRHVLPVAVITSWREVAAS